MLTECNYSTFTRPKQSRDKAFQTKAVTSYNKRQSNYGHGYDR